MWSSKPFEQGNVYENCLDLMRIGIFMKDHVDSAISKGILRFQCIVYKVDFYMLDLKGDVLNLMNHIAQISVPCNYRGHIYFIANFIYILWVESYNRSFTTPIITLNTTTEIRRLVAKLVASNGNVHYGLMYIVYC